MDGLALRIAGLADARPLAALIAGFRDHLQATVPTDSEIRAHLPRSLAEPGIEFCCAWLEGAAVGYTQTRYLTSVWAAGIEAHLEDLFVVEFARRKSLGRALLRHALDRARARGAARFSLNTNEANQAAQSLYRAEGLLPQSHALYPGGREVLFSKEIATS